MVKVERDYPLPKSWYRRYGIDWDEWLSERLKNIDGPNCRLRKIFNEQILADEWLNEYVMRLYKRGDGITVLKYLWLLIDSQIDRASREQR